MKDIIRAKEIKEIIKNGTFSSDAEYIKLLDEVETIVKNSNDVKFALELNSFLSSERGFNLISEGEYLKAKELVEHDFLMANKYQNKEALMATRTLASLLEYSLSNYTKSLQHLIKGLSIAEELNDEKSKIIFLNNIGDLFMKFKDYDKALTYFIQVYQILAKEVHKKDYNYYISIVEYNLIYTYLNLKDYKNAKIYYLLVENLSKYGDSLNEEILQYAIEIAINVHVVGKIDDVKRSFSNLINYKKKPTDDLVNIYEAYTIAIEALMEINTEVEVKQLLDLLSETVKAMNTNRSSLKYCKMYIDYLSKFHPENTSEIHNYYQKYYEISINDLKKNDENYAKALNVELKFNKSESRQRAEERRNDELYRLSTTDSLTSIYNRHYFETTISEIFKTKDHRIALIIFDIDHFKSFNDNYGHLHGDEILKSVASVLKEKSNKHCIPFRYGGDEFICLLIDTTEDQVLDYIKELQDSMKLLKKKLNIKNITLSIGYTYTNTKDTNQDDLLERADKALYIAKKIGRNNFQKL